MRISIITPSIRPDGLAVVEKTLDHQRFSSFEWLPKLSRVGDKPDLCKQMNAAIREAKGELVVFLQDWTDLSDVNALQRCWELYMKKPTVGWTMPVGKVKSKNPEWGELVGPIKWDWRHSRQPGEAVNFSQWEIDFGMIQKNLLELVGGFDEAYDDGFGWENVDLACRLYKGLGVSFCVDPTNVAVAFDHDGETEHPYRKKPNSFLWTRREQTYVPGEIAMGSL